MQSHEYADLFPMMGEQDITRLADDIRKNGQADPIITHEGKILDGRNRFKACTMAEVTPTFSEFSGEDALAFVISHNLHRRHLTESQRAMVASKVATIRLGDNQHNQGSPIGEPSKLSHKDRATAAAELNVGTSSLDRARRVQRDGIPELNDMVETGEVSVSAALEVSKLPEIEQRKAVSGGVSGVKEAAKAQATPKPSPAQPAEPKSEKIPKWIPDDADRLWLMAKQELGKILSSDKSRERVLREVIEYAQQRIEKNI